MKKTINEQQLKRLVREAIDELKYSTYKSAHDKMQDKGQIQRANDFNRTFKDIYDDGNTSFNLDYDEVMLTNPEDKAKNQPSNRTLYTRDGSTYNNGKYSEPTRPQRTNDRALARKHAGKLDFFYGGASPYDRNDFIAECVDRVFAKYLK